MSHRLRRSRRLRRLLLPALLFCLTHAAAPTAAWTQPMSSSALHAATAWSCDAIVHGVDAIGVNPALIGEPRGTMFSITIAPFALRAGTDFLSYDSYKRYFTGVPSSAGREPYKLTQADKDQLIAAFDGPTGRISAGVSMHLFAATLRTPIGAFGLSMSDHVRNEAILPRDYAEFLLNGNPPGRTFDFSETRLLSTWHRAYALTWAMDLVRPSRRGVSFTAGATIKLLHGYGYFGVERFNSHFTTDPDSFVVTGHAGILARYAGAGLVDGSRLVLPSLFPTLSGSGVGIDAGAVLGLGDRVRIGVAVTDLGSISWSHSARESSADEDFRINDLTTDSQVQDIITRVNGTERSIASFSSSLPAVFALSAAWSVGNSHAKHPPPLRLTASIRAGLDETYAHTNGARAGAGADWRVFEAVSLRAGLSSGGALGTMYGLGLGVHMGPMTLDLATNHITGVFTSQFSTVSFAAALRLDL
jgi:hypothetical protein